MEALIVGKTHKRSTACVGAISLSDHKPLRLFNSQGDDPPADSTYELGQIWDLEFRAAPNIVPPFYEDVWVKKRKYLRDMDEVTTFLLSNMNAWRGNPDILFDGTVKFRATGTGEISKSHAPSVSTGFWIPDQDLCFEEDAFPGRKPKRSYSYGSGQAYRRFTYVGYQEPEAIISAGTLVRMSLSRWWKPDNAPADQEQLCHPQLSGWYL